MSDIELNKSEYLNPDKVAKRPSEIKSWEFSGYGEIKYIDTNENFNNTSYKALNDNDLSHNEHSRLLNELEATSICANDISSRCFFVTGLILQVSGAYSVITSLLVVFILYCYRFIYAEAVTALPMNGGTFNVLCHTTSKRVASYIACLSIISYVSTGTVSAVEAVEYLQNLIPSINSNLFVVGILLIFMIANLFGLSESAKISSGILIIHLISMFILILCSIIWLFNNGFDIYSFNYNNSQYNFFESIFYGLAWGILGISGYETSAQYVQEQKPGVYIKTLKNMYIIVAILNPILSFLSSCMINIIDFEHESEQTQNALLAELGRIAGGSWLEYWISIDAFIILSGTVLTGYVGMVGLVKRMTRDRCLPSFLKENSYTNTNHYIIITYFLICTSLYFVLGGDVTSLSEVYIMCFLGLLLAFAYGNYLIKINRDNIPRDIYASNNNMFFGIILVILALISTLIQEADILDIFLAYYFVVDLIMIIMFYRFTVLRWLHVIIESNLFIHLLRYNIHYYQN